MSTEMGPVVLKNEGYMFDNFISGEVVEGKKKNHLPAMGWNSWNAFGSGNTEALTKEMADCIVELGLDKLGYKYIVLDDGCYLPKRVDGKLGNEDVKFPGGFKSLSDYIHGRGLKFGMYNDIGTNLCAGAEVGTCGHEYTDAASYIEWGVDFLKVDNCYYLWDNATFSDARNARYVYAPMIKSVRVCGNGADICLSAAKDGILRGEGAMISEDGQCVYGIGTFDGTGPDRTPVGDESSELLFDIEAPADGEYKLTIEYKSGEEPLIGSWIQVKTAETGKYIFDNFIEKETDTDDGFMWSKGITVNLNKGVNTLRLMNHRRQENTLSSYGKLLEGLNAVKPDHDIIYSICEWGKTQPQNWGYKVGDSWRILNDITFQVGRDGDPGKGDWTSDYTTSVTSQYNKAVIMDEFAGLTKGWNDPDMMMIGMNGLTEVMNKTHMTMWCMMNSPLMLGLDLRRVKKGDEIYNIIANSALIALNQDALGVQAKRVKVYCDREVSEPSREYIRDNNRVDILAKPLSDGSLAVSFINLSGEVKEEGYEIDLSEVLRKLNIQDSILLTAKVLKCSDLWSGDSTDIVGKTVRVESLNAYDNVTLKISAVD